VIQILEGKRSAGADADWLAPAGQRSGFDVSAPEMPLAERILIGAFVFGIIGLFTFIGVVTPGGMGWFLYLFRSRFWSMFPMFIFGSGAALKILAPTPCSIRSPRSSFSRQPWYRKAVRTSRTKAMPKSVAWSSAPAAARVVSPAAAVSRGEADARAAAARAETGKCGDE